MALSKQESAELKLTSCLNCKNLQSGYTSEGEIGYRCAPRSDVVIIVPSSANCPEENKAITFYLHTLAYDCGFFAAHI